MPLAVVGKWLLGLGLLLCLVGGGLWVLSRLGLERLPGDVVVRRGPFTLYAPFGLMLLVSLVLTLVLNFLARR